MSSPQSEMLTLDDFRVIVQRAGLELDQAEMERLLPMYQNLIGQLAALHDPALPLGLPADTFSPDWAE